MINLTSEKTLDKVLRKYRLQAKKDLGQHFLTDESVLLDILDASELSEEDNVVEIGPGLGVLSVELAQKCGTLRCIELDEAVVTPLKDHLNMLEDEGICKADWKIELEDVRDASNFSGDYKVIANIPYYLTDRIIRKFIEEVDKSPSLMVLLIQKEVAEKIVAPYGKESIPSIACKVYGDAEIISVVGQHAFDPPPKVDSAVLRIRMFDEPKIDFGKCGFSVTEFFNVVRAGFGMKRKKLTNSLSANLKIEKEDANSLLEAAGIDPGLRAEKLSLDDWERLAKAHYNV